MTETQPDPQVPWAADPSDVDCPDCYAPAGEPCVGDDGRAVDHFHIDRINDAPSARTPLTVADIPAGQGPASLFIAPADVLGYTDGNAALWIQTEDGPLFIRWASKSGDSEANRALWDHLAATLPHVTTEAAP